MFNVRRLAFLSLEVPEGRRNVAHCGNSGGQDAIVRSPEGAAQWSRPVPPLRGLALCLHAYPPLAQWATFFRP